MSQPIPAPKTTIKAVNPWFVVIAVGGSLALAAYLVPRTDELVKRLMVDGQHARALAVSTEAKSVPELHPAGPPATSSVRPKTALETLQAFFNGQLDEPMTQDPASCIAQAADPVACRELVRKIAPGLETEQMVGLYLATGKSAVAAGNPALAGEIFEEAWQKGGRSEPLLAEIVQAFRWCGRPEKALAILETWRKEQPIPAALEDVQIAVYREVNQPAKALDLLLERLEKAKASGSISSEMMLLASEVAANAGQVQRILPAVREYLGTLPAGRATFEELAAGKVKPSAEWTRFATLVAQHCEWGGRPGEAFDFYMKLAVCGDASALQRILELDPGLSRDGDVLAVLRHVVPLEGRPQLTLQLARMLADAAEYEEAARIYGLWLNANPRDVKALKELAAMEAECSHQQEALRHYQKARELAPDDLEVQKEIADIQISLRQFREAFEFYQNLPEKEHDSVTLENYALLAESLAEYAAFNRALVLRQHRLKKPAAQDFLELARSFEIVGDTSGVISTLKSGMAVLPKSRILRIDLANIFRKEGQYDEAIALLAIPELKSDMQAMQLFIEVCCLKEDYQFALAFLGRGFENKFAFGPEVRLDLGHIYFNNGYLADADRLYSSVPDEPALWPLLAAARFKQGDYASAEAYQRKYVKSLRVPDAPAWMFLGDICKMLGREADAKAAYDTSLLQMEDKMNGAGDDETPHAAAAAKP